MHKKIAAELVSLANSILEMKNNDDVAILQKKAQLLYEKLSVLKFVNTNLDLVADAESKIDNEAVLANIEIEKPVSPIETFSNVIEQTIEKPTEIDLVVEKLVESNEVFVNKTEEENEVVTPKEVTAIFESENAIIDEEKAMLTELQFTLEDEFKDAISADVATSLFERVTKENPVVEEKEIVKPKSLNDSLFSTNLQVGLNDRIAFVKHLFEGSQEDFNRVLSQLNSFKSQDEAITFIEEIVKPDYNWDGKLEYEERLMSLIERKFS
jgi:hypothetical protein